MPYRMIYDQEKCVACGTCAIACMDQCDIDVDTQVPFRRVFTREEHKDGKTSIYYLSVGCMYCQDAPCQGICPKGCYSRDAETGLVRLDNGGCIGCRQCSSVCPLDAVGFGSSGRAGKCNGCIERLKLGLLPACMKACQEDAIRFEHVEDGSEAGGEPQSIAFLLKCLEIGQSRRRNQK